jgi:glutamate carboxypeptidase
VNTIPETAELAVDVRAWNAGELQRVDQELRKLGPHSAEVASGVNRYPLEADQSAPLLARARAVAAERRLPDIGEAHVGGASDGNFTAALGIHTLEGVGAENAATLCGLGVFVDEPAEPVSSDDLDVGVVGVG